MRQNVTMHIHSEIAGAACFQNGAFLELVSDRLCFASIDYKEATMPSPDPRNPDPTVPTPARDPNEVPANPDPKPDPVPQPPDLPPLPDVPVGDPPPGPAEPPQHM